ncbi:iron-containing alcohol dehydrogenase [Dactylosporangium vinaceum]|uniref:Iron-containing alcohol dehydrogenase n=1 Tax=Dactylosporangium vinaceum TaxID=53362 RepID=A0ABV5M5U8_9ACTN|nr:iron-containing alcohol dehydrogenase [Dactylosporangium vinaceum]UAC01261.1 iron-containing alcohol dehydrogenase [Dactylosporangium vinaceum]
MTRSPYEELSLAFGDASVPYLYGHDCTPALAGALVDRLAAGPAGLDAVLLVTDDGVRGHAAAVAAELARHVRVATVPLQAEERHKTLPTVQHLLESAVAQGLTRRSAIVAMGGGTVGNIAGLAAALLFRGTRLVHLPTTPVAAFDATVSLKQGVNLSAGKNLAGTYFVPTLIACDLAWLATVPRHDLLTGMAEMVKNILVAAPELEKKLVVALDGAPPDLRALLEVGVEAKAPFVAADPRERAGALIFEYGHTAGHAIEFVSGGTIRHGEAVAWGMLIAAEVARRRHGLAAPDVARHHRLTALLDLPAARTRLQALDRGAIRAALAADNKRGYGPCAPGEVLMVLLDGIGRPVPGPPGGPPLVPVPVSAVIDALEEL